MKAESFNILITSVSRKSDLVIYFKKALKNLKIKGKVIGVDCDNLSPALYLSDKSYIVKKVKAPGYYKEILEISKKENVRLIIPTMDLELSGWAKRRDKFLNEGIFVLISDKKAVDKTIDKVKTYKFFKTLSIPTPPTLTFNEIKKVKDSMFPLFIKPRFGRGSEGTFKIENYRELSFYIWKITEPIIQEYLEGKEFTVDVLSDLEGKFITAVPRKRLLIRAGVSDRGKTFYNKKIVEYSKKIVESLNLIGPSNIQGKIKGRSISFFEINPRFSGGISLTIESGVNFPELIIKMLTEKKISKKELEFKKDFYMLSYSSHVFLPSEQLRKKIKKKASKNNF